MTDTVVFDLHEADSVAWTVHESTPVEWNVRQGAAATSGGSGPSLSNTNPSALGTAAPGASTSASRADHVHAMPTAAQVGAQAAGAGAGGVLSGNYPNPGFAVDMVEQTEMVSYVAAQIAAAIAGLIDGAPGALDTLNELAAAINDDASFASAVTTALAGKVPTSRTIAGLDLSADRTATAVRSALGSGTPDSSTFLRGDGAWAVPAGGSEWTQEGTYTTATSNDWPTFTGVGDYRRYKITWEYPEDVNGASVGALFRNLSAVIDSDTTAGNYFNNASSASALTVTGVLGQGGPGFGSIEFQRGFFNTAGTDLHGLIGVAEAVASFSGGGSQAVRSAHTYRVASGSRPSCASWALSASNNDAWTAGITFTIWGAD